MDFSDFQYHKSKIPSEFLKKEIYFEELRNQFYEEIKQRKDHEEYLSRFDPKNIDSFLLSYANEKAVIIKSYEFYLDESKYTPDLQYREDAESIFRIIQQKKLFNLQLEWRAEKIIINEIKISEHFHFWEKHIEQCPFLPPVTSMEVETMKNYLRNPDSNTEFRWMFVGWQDYDDLMSKNEEDDYELMHDWYEYYDTYMGTGILLLLPDIRGQKEDFYRSKGYKHFWDKVEKERKSNPVKPKPNSSFLNSDAKAMYEYAVKFEKDPYIIELFRLYEQIFKKSDLETGFRSMMIDEALGILYEAKTPVYIEGYNEWDDAILECARRYKNNVIANELDAVFEEYQMCNNLGIKKYGSIKNLEEEYLKDPCVKIVSDYILDGRECHGEPRDYNF